MYDFSPPSFCSMCIGVKTVGGGNGHGPRLRLGEVQLAILKEDKGLKKKTVWS